MEVLGIMYRSLIKKIFLISTFYLFGGTGNYTLYEIKIHLKL